ncbi:nucleotide exchange factor GrpE [Desulfosudis oleivorans]|uniref:Protein GrpE n=1 Tax=Desulfosudis oleivorans (strain DSM 6200 / JCM 39069 / Hxd3) TaxID=96561 RepID=A8ZRW2_DESOH|nr:nucleotide exchange factor GrpE [Desulfosudis oleivorans]ABW65879.1 GrpE protein [Desulfosudis oleivorans Hxd3]
MSKKIRIRDDNTRAQEPEMAEEADLNTEDWPEEASPKAETDTGPDQEVQEEDPIEVLDQQLEAALEEKKKVEDKLLRAAAEFDNYKKRLEKQWADFKKYAHEAVIRELLSVVDNLERAIVASKDTADQNECLLSGVDMTLTEILKVFEKFGVTRIDALGRSFDPNFHEAVARRETDDTDANIVIEEYQKGYMIHDRLLRPAMVVVSAGRKNGNSAGG